MSRYTRGAAFSGIIFLPLKSEQEVRFNKNPLWKRVFAVNGEKMTPEMQRSGLFVFYFG